MRNGLLACLLCACMSAAAAEAPVVRLETSAGNIDIELHSTEAPQSVANFLDLVDSNFYDGLIFHRVVANFVIQAGGYDAQLKYREPPRQVPNESRNGLANRRGTVAMARLADPHSADAQFYINVNDNAHLDPQGGGFGYTVFGKVVAGMEAVVDIELMDTETQNGMVGVPATPVVIHRARRLTSEN
ncbi:MAG: peptidylprolyl isomerase [Gammaproteobacteria bacterium]|nr:peptidylprolyl isomerase [Gammaproteobacteria bacterium]MDE0272198.1 peptidylprolyl isomerase [Gammaproteobacteria bacterium]